MKRTIKCPTCGTTRKRDFKVLWRHREGYHEMLECKCGRRFEDYQVRR